ncbi:MAG: hypothetical protein CMQ43_10040 [Gammaproteobacteria bacterium]|nr:hypothetical protein [Gammaproteobacteria bacterium]
MGYHRLGGRLAAGAIIALVMATGCTSTSRHAPDAGPDDPVAECRVLFRDTDRAVSAAGVGDAQSWRIPGLPYLRSNRFLAGGVAVPDSGPAFDAWVERLRGLDRSARRAELANLPAGRLPPDRLSALDRCAAVLQRVDLAAGTRRAALTRVRVPDAYRRTLRILGLYPLSSQPFLLGVHGLHRETERVFATPLDGLPVAGRLVRVGPAGTSAGTSPDTAAAILARSARNPLGIPLPDDAALAELFERHAPIWEIDVGTDSDSPGTPRFDPAGRVVVDGAPAVFTLASHTRWYGETLLQLNYLIWFPARPRTGPFDLVGGRLDGVIWRVTLGPDGRPLIYDSVHACGCYHKFYPTPRARLVASYRGWEEPLLVPQSIPDGPDRLVIRLSSGSHYVERVYRAESARNRQASTYTLEDYDRLRSLPHPEHGRRSLFDPDGIVPGSERRERWLFWPMGIPEPGAMRQWGQHATAFVGRRHFDDPGLMARYFAPVETPAKRRSD